MEKWRIEELMNTRDEKISYTLSRRKTKTKRQMETFLAKSSVEKLQWAGHWRKMDAKPLQRRQFFPTGLLPNSFRSFSWSGSPETGVHS